MPDSFERPDGVQTAMNDLSNVHPRVAAGNTPVLAGRNRAGVRCRPIRPDDVEALVRLLVAGFPARDDAYWRRGLERLDQHTRAHGFPHYGYVLQSGDRLVGVLLMIFRRLGTGPEAGIRCNLSSWCADADFRSYAPLLVATATRDKAVTYTNISPERSTRPMIEVQGFVRYVDGLYMTVPLAAQPWRSARLQDGAQLPDGVVSPDDLALMQAHAALDCIRAWCVTDNAMFPLIFIRTRHVRGLVSAVHVIYCPNTDLLRMHAFAIGRFLAGHGIFMMTFDAAASRPGLVGRFLSDRMPKYFKGPDRPRLGDLAFTELAFFGA